MIKLYDKVVVLECDYCKPCPVSEKVGTVIYKLEENNKQTIIECLEVNRDIDIIYIAAIAKTIEYIEKPF